MKSALLSLSLLLLTLAGSGGTASGQVPSTSPGEAAGPEPAVQAPPAQPRSANGGGAADAGSANEPARISVGPGDELRLTFDNLKAVEALLADKKGKRLGGKRLVLYIDSRPMGIEPAVWNARDQELTFTLERNAANASHWRSLLNVFGERDVRVEVGLDGDPATAAAPSARHQRVRLRNYADAVWWGLAILLVLVTAALLTLLGLKTGALRDAPPTGRTVPEGKRPFSLGRIQMAWWFLVIISAFLFLWLVFGEGRSLNSTALTLLGLSLGTGLVARSIDATKVSKVSATEGELEMLRARKVVLETKPVLDRTPEETQEITDVSGRIGGLERALTETVMPLAEFKSRGLWRDILSDESGVCLHRLQMVVWTLVISAVFVLDLWKSRAMPELDNTLLGVMGISAGAFLGFKMPEKQSVPSAT